MASWLKAAEGLFEVVDRKAKLVVSELGEEQSDSQPSVASNGQGSEAKKTKPKPKKKALKRQSKDGISKASDVAREQTGNLAPQEIKVTLDKDRGAPLIKKDGGESGEHVIQKTNEEVGNLGNDSLVSGIAITNSSVNDSTENETDHGKFQVPDTEDITVTSTLKGNLPIETTREASEENSSNLLSKETEIINENHAVVVEREVQRGDSDAPPEIDQVASESQKIDVENNSEVPLKVINDKIEASVNQTKQDEQKPDTSQKEKDQLDEAQGLLKTAISTGHSKEARLARVCANLSSRLQEYKAENAQLEELLVAERELSKSYESHIKQLQNQVSESKGEVTRVETGMVEALAAKNSEIEALVNSMEALKKQAALSEGSLASLQANMESIMRNRELAETRMMQALREELACAERRAEEERSAHNATKMASMEREVELEHRAIESSTALARIQRIADERTAKAADLEQKLALLEVECANLNQELQDMESRVRRGQKKSPEEANQAIQIQAWQDEVERARQGQRDAEGKLSSLDAEVQKMRVELAAMKRDAEHYSRQEHVELEKRYRELTDLLYYKQTQLETMASEKAAAEFQLEKELKRLHEAQAEAERSRVSRRPSSSWEEDTEMKTLEELPLHHRHMEGARVQLQKAAKFLDSGAVRATRFLWRYPKARVLLLFYLVFVHLFLMYLLHRLQEQADELLVREVKFMGLSKP